MTSETIGILAVFSMCYLAAAMFFGARNVLELFVYYRKTGNGVEFGLGPMAVLAVIWVLVYFVL